MSIIFLLPCPTYQKSVLTNVRTHTHTHTLSSSTPTKCCLRHVYAWCRLYRTHRSVNVIGDAVSVLIIHSHNMQSVIILFKNHKQMKRLIHKSSRHILSRHTIYRRKLFTMAPYAGHYHCMRQIYIFLFILHIRGCVYYSIDKR